MKFCQHCGSEINENAIICVKCGRSVETVSERDVDNSVSGGLVFLSIMIPLFGIIYWPVNARKRPKCAITCGISAIVSWAVCAVLLMFI